jgi:hypothetical protein
MAYVGGVPPLNVGPGLFAFLALACCLAGVTGWYLSLRHPSNSDRTLIRRRLALVLLGLALIFSVALGVLHQTVTSLVTIALGILLAVSLWPASKRWWGHNLGGDNKRPYDNSSYYLALGAGILGLGFGGLFLLVASNDSQSDTSTLLLGVLFLAQGVTYLIEAWDERRRLWWENGTAHTRQP